MDFTTEQQLAITTHDRNMVVVAGAGSGKTSVLVRRYLALLEANLDWPLTALVAITFTQKAAQEMRDRVRQTIQTRLERAVTGDEITIWSMRLAAMDSARIDTIHALCASLLRSNAAEAAIDPQFAVLDETDAQILLENVIDDEIRKMVGENDPALRLFYEYDPGTVRRTVENFIGDDLPDIPADPFSHWAAQWQQDCHALLTALVQNPEFIVLARWQPIGGWPSGSDNALISWQNCLSYLPTLVDANQTAEIRLEILQKLRAGIDLRGGSRKVWGSDDVLKEAKEGLKTLRAMADAALKHIGDPPGEFDRRAAELLPLWVSLVRRMQTAYREAKIQNSLLDFNDLENRTRRLLSNHPEVCARYRGQEFKHLLVDEFQDTNAAQWEIVQALADPRQPGCLFVVGDAKQSIYAFRGADVSVFSEVRRQLRAVGGQEVAMMLSFRTHQPLVSCFNALFEKILKQDDTSPVRDYQIAFEAMQAARPEPPSAAPALEFILIDEGEANGESLKSDDRRRQEAYQIARRLREMVEDEGRMIYDKRERIHRPMQYGDVALLFQSMTSITLYEEVLKAANIRFVTIAGRGYYNRQEVWDLVNLLRVLYNPADNLSLAVVLRSPMFSLSDDTLLGLRLMYDNGTQLLLWEALERAAQEPQRGITEDEMALVASATTTLGELHRIAGRVTIAELLREALGKTGYLATLTGLPDGDRRRGNVEKLLEKAKSSGKITLGAFSQYLNDLSEREAREGEALVEVAQSLTLMTVHKSKGLEFPLVVLADSSWERGHLGSSVLLHDRTYGLSCQVLDEVENKLQSPVSYTRAARLGQLREEAERRRLLYVAATRAQDYLLVSGQVKASKKEGMLSAKGWLGWLLEAFDLKELERAPIVECPTEWGTMRVCFPDMIPDAVIDGDQRDGAPTAWDSRPVQRGEPIPGVGAHQPELLRPVAYERDSPARYLSATQVSDLSGIELPGEGERIKSRMRRVLLSAAPAYIDMISARHRRITGRKLGEIVHKALRWWRFPGPGDRFDDLLRSYAWEEGIVDYGQQQYAVQEARKLLQKIVRSDVFAWINDAAQVYRELPFAYHTGKRTIYGVIDVLFQRHDGTWAVVDYKTSAVRDLKDNSGALEDHAQRYYLQVGVYAAAVREQLRDIVGESSVVPDVYIHYIRHSATVTVSQAQWESALNKLEDYIGVLTGHT